MPRLIFFGTPSFAVPTLRALLDSGFEVAAVVSAPDRPAGRGHQLRSCPVAEFGRERNLLVVQPERLKDSHIVSLLSSLQAKVGVLVAYGKIIPPEILDIFPHGIINLHPSLLPKYRGPSPIAGAILSGESVTGISLMRLDAEMDHGPIVAQEEEPIAPEDTALTLSLRLAERGAQLMVERLPRYLAGSILLQEQDHTQATYTHLVKIEDGQVKWSEPVSLIERQWRAYQPWPGLYSSWQGKRLKFGRLEALEVTPQAAPGTVLTLQGLSVQAGRGVIRIHELQLEGSKMVSAEAFLRGHRTFGRSILGE